MISCLPSITFRRHAAENILDLPETGQEVNDEEDYLATGFRNVAGAKTEKMIRCLDALQSMVCFQRYQDRSLKLLRGSDKFGAAYERTSLRG